MNNSEQIFLNELDKNAVIEYDSIPFAEKMLTLTAQLKSNLLSLGYEVKL